MEQNDIAHSKDNWSGKTGGKTFRYCIIVLIAAHHILTIKTYYKNKEFGVSGCVHLGRKIYTAATEN